ncbi:MAG: HNH endonuclease [Bacteroidia bacterium]|nr:HNH endonuclease [Bacteroidia bacterium]
MIRLLDIPKPALLTDAFVAKLTSEYLVTGKTVWRIPCIVDGLHEMGRGKCAFCELKFDTSESKFLEVDHFKAKHLYPKLVVDWSNLLPICKRCNVRKGRLDVAIDGLLNPRYEDPSLHLCIRKVEMDGFMGFLLRSKTDLGKATIKKLGLLEDDLGLTSDLGGKMEGRNQLLDRVLKDLDRISDAISRIDWTLAAPSDERRYVTWFTEILQSAQPDSQYTAIVATALFDDERFKQLCNFFRSNHLWDEQMGTLLDEAFANKLDLIY